MERKPNVYIVPAMKGYQLFYYGPPLHQQHAVVFQSLMELTKGRQGEVILTQAEVLRTLGLRSTDKKCKAHLWAMLEDLMRVKIQLSTPTVNYQGELIHRVTKEEGKGQLRVRIDENLTKLFANEVLYEPLSHKLALGGGELVRWLHSYLSSQYKCFPIKLPELQRLSGSTLEARKFRYALKQACEALMQSASPLLTRWTLSSDGVFTYEKRRTKVLMLREPTSPKFKAPSQKRGRGGLVL